MVVATRRRERVRGKELEIYLPRKLHSDHVSISEKLNDIYSREGVLRSDHSTIIEREGDLRGEHNNIISRANSLRDEHGSIYDRARNAINDQKDVLSNQITLGKGHNAISSRLDALERRIAAMERKVIVGKRYGKGYETISSKLDTLEEKIAALEEKIAHIHGCISKWCR